MASEYTPCAYHPKKIAVTTCTRCKRAICLEDKRVFTTGGSTNYHSYDYCVICYATRLKSNSQFITIGAIIALVIPLLIIISMAFDGTSISSSDILPFVLFIGIFFFAFFLNYTISKNKASKAEQDANDFISKLDDKSILVPSTDGVSQDFVQNSSFSSYKNHQLICFECGAYITRKDKFCPNCGDSTKDELKAALSD